MAAWPTSSSQNLGAGLPQLLGGLLALGVAVRDDVLRLLVDRLGRRGCCSPSAGTTACPAARWLKQVSHRYRTPANSVIAISVFSWLLIALIYVLTKALGGDPFFLIAGVTSVSTVLLYWAYGLCIALGLWGNQEWRNERVWSLGRWSRPLAWISIIWIILITPLFLFPFA